MYSFGFLQGLFEEQEINMRQIYTEAILSRAIWFVRVHACFVSSYDLNVQTCMLLEMNGLSWQYFTLDAFFRKQEVTTKDKIGSNPTIFSFEINVSRYYI